MKAEQYTWLGKICAIVGEGVDIDTTSTYIATTNVIRAAAKEASYIYNKTQFEEETTGIYLPEGCVEYFKVNIGDEIAVISGSVNISSIK